MRSSLLAAALAAVSMLACGAKAQSIATQDADVFATGRTVTLDWVPVTNSAGVTVFKDITINLNVDGGGNITYSASKPTVTLSPTVSPVALKSGVYIEQGNTNPIYTLQINGPQPLASGGGAYGWTTATTGTNYGSPVPAVFYTGPIAGYPAVLKSRIQAAGMATKTYLGFGTVNSNGTGNGPAFYSKDLFGVFVIGNHVFFDDFTCGNGQDLNAPCAEISYVHK
jgi:hypothetical protein